MKGLRSAKLLVARLAELENGSHAVLFYGAEGAGKSLLARRLAAAWTCTGEPPRPCGACRPCQAMAKGTLVDLLMIDPRGASRNIRRLGAIVPDPTPPRESEEPQGPPLTDFLRTPPLIARSKVVIFDHADRLIPDASHALLRILEEPPTYARLILITDQPGALAPTVLSRCLAICCELPSGDEINGLAGELEPELIALAGGSPGVLARIGELADWYRSLLTFAKNLLGRPAAQALVASEEFDALCDELEASGTGGSRAAKTAALGALADALKTIGTPPEWPVMVAETHRRIQRNAASGIAFDALFVRLLVDRL